MKKPDIKVFAHSGMVVVNRGDSCDLVDPITGRWQQFPTQRAAKWSATVWHRLNAGFGYDNASDSTLQARLQHEQRKAMR